MSIKVAECLSAILFNGTSILFSIYSIYGIYRTSQYQIAFLHAANILAQIGTILTLLLSIYYEGDGWRHMGYLRMGLVCFILYGLLVIDVKILKAFGSLDSKHINARLTKKLNILFLCLYLCFNIPYLVARLSSFVIGSIPSWLDMASNYTIFGWFFIFICYDNSQAIYLFLLISKKVYSNKNIKIKEQLKLNVSICLLDWVVVILTIIVTFTDVDYWKVLQQITMACIGGHVYLLVKVYQGMVKVFDTSSAMGPALDPRVGAASVSSGVDDG